MSDLNAKRPTTSQRKRARKLVLQALYQLHLNDASVSQIEAEFRADNDMEKVDSAFFQELIRGVPQNLGDIDKAIEPVIDRALSELDPIEINILRMGVYEFKHRIDVPYRVVINEAVELAKQFGGTDGHKYVNGILDKLAPKYRAAECNAR